MSSAFLPPPAALGLPEAFNAWRPGQIDAVLHALDAKQRFTGLVLPTGFGKSLVYMAIAHLSGAHDDRAQTVILTRTKALQRQLMRDFAALDGTILVQGQRAYLCTALEPGGELFMRFAEGGSRRQTFVDAGPCHVGVFCSKKLGGCEYFDTLRDANDAKIIITNYAWWMSDAARSIRPTLLVLDEGHEAPDALADALGASIPPQLVQAVLGETMPGSGKLTSEGWSEWARAKAVHLAKLLDGAQPATREAMMKIRRAQSLARLLKRVTTIRPELLLVSDELDAIRFDVVWAAPHAEDELFRRVGRVLLTSATMTRHTADLIGIMEKDLSMYEGGDGFPKDRRPVYISPARMPPFGDPVRVDHRLSPEGEAAWLAHIDKIIDGRRDRKGIIHSVSYRRRDLLLLKSKHHASMMTHGRHDAEAKIADFKAARPGSILVSPAVTTGYDFPYEECEYQIVCKVPFPDRRDPVTNARTIIDARYPNHLAMQTLVQAVGRGMRAADDRCETFVVDGHAIWQLNKHLDLAPRWFRRAVQRLEPGSIPTSPPPLGLRQR